MQPEFEEFPDFLIFFLTFPKSVLYSFSLSLSIIDKCIVVFYFPHFNAKSDNYLSTDYLSPKRRKQHV